MGWERQAYGRPVVQPKRQPYCPAQFPKGQARVEWDATRAVTFTETHERGGAGPKYGADPFGKSETGSYEFFARRRQRRTAGKIPGAGDFGCLVKLLCLSPPVTRRHPLSVPVRMATAYGLRGRGVLSPNKLLWAALRGAPSTVTSTVTGSPRPTACKNFRRVGIDVDSGTLYNTFVHALGVPRRLCLWPMQRSRG